MSDNYQRLFFIFKNMDTIDGRPTGYLKIETYAGVAKLQLSISSLPERRGWEYRLFGIKRTSDKLQYTDICPIQVLNNRADVKISAQCNSLGSNGLNLEDMDVYAVIARNPDGIQPFLCPLVTYVHGEIEWKKQLGELLTAKENNSEKIQPVNPLQVNSGKDATDELPGTDSMDAETQEQETDQPLGQETEESPPLSTDVVDETDDIGDTDAIDDISDKGDAEEIVNPDIGGLTLPIENVEPVSEIPEMDSEDNTWLDVENRLRAEEQMGTQEDWSYNVSSDNDILETSSLDTNGSIPNLREELDNSFEKYNPFKIKSKNFHWWKINSPGFLNNILFRNNIKSYLLFNPKVMLAHYKYRYIIFGVRSMRRAGREQLVCGIPGVYSIDENPFGSMGSWVQLEGYKPKYGAFGYWIVMIDPRTGKLIKIK